MVLPLPYGSHRLLVQRLLLRVRGALRRLAQDAEGLADGECLQRQGEQHTPDGFMRAQALREALYRSRLFMDEVR